MGKAYFEIMSIEKVSRRIKIHTLIFAVSAGIAVASYLLQTLVLAPLGIGNTEQFGLGLFVLTQLPFAFIAGVMGFVAFFYGMKNPTWRAGRIVALVLSVILLVVFVLPVVAGMVIHTAPVAA